MHNIKNDGLSKTFVWYKFQVGGQHCFAVAHHFLTLMELCQIIGTFGGFWKIF